MVDHVAPRVQWAPTNDDDLPKPEIASAALGAMDEGSAAQGELAGYRRAFDTIKDWSVVVARGSDDAVVAIHIDWSAQSVVTAWKASCHCGAIVPAEEHTDDCPIWEVDPE